MLDNVLRTACLRQTLLLIAANNGIRQTIAQRLQRQRTPAPFGFLEQRCAGKKFSLSQYIQIFADHRRIIDDGTILQHQRGNFSEWIDGAKFRIGRKLDEGIFYPRSKTQFVNNDARLSGIGGIRGIKVMQQLSDLQTAPEWLLLCRAREFSPPRPVREDQSQNSSRRLFHTPVPAI